MDRCYSHVMSFHLELTFALEDFSIEPHTTVGFCPESQMIVTPKEVVRPGCGLQHSKEHPSFLIKHSFDSDLQSLISRVLVWFLVLSLWCLCSPWARNSSWLLISSWRSCSCYFWVSVSVGERFKVTPVFKRAACIWLSTLMCRNKQYGYKNYCKWRNKKKTFTVNDVKLMLLLELFVIFQLCLK